MATCSSRPAHLPCSPWGTIRALCWAWGGRTPNRPSLSWHQRRLPQPCRLGRGRQQGRRQRSHPHRRGTSMLPDQTRLPSCPGCPPPSRSQAPLRHPKQSPLLHSCSRSPTGTSPRWEWQGPQTAGASQKEMRPRLAALRQPPRRCQSPGCPCRHLPARPQCRAGALLPRRARLLIKCVQHPKSARLSEHEMLVYKGCDKCLHMT